MSSPSPDSPRESKPTHTTITGQALGDQASTFRLMLDNLPMSAALLLVDENKTFPIVAANAIALSQVPGADLEGLNAINSVSEEWYNETRVAILGCYTSKQTITIESSRTLDHGLTIWYENKLSPIMDADGVVTHILALIIDVSERKQQERIVREQNEIILRQYDELNELSTPLLSISDRTLVLPLIGSIDSRRISQLISSLLEGISSKKAEHVIIDITGVPIVDTQVANALIQATQAVKLLGAQVILSGIRPEVAKTLVGLGIDFGTLLPQATLQSAIARTLAH
jgi:PAS domain S-box-containing protein